MKWIVLLMLAGLVLSASPLGAQGPQPESEAVQMEAEVPQMELQEPQVEAQVPEPEGEASQPDAQTPQQETPATHGNADTSFGGLAFDGIVDSVPIVVWAQALQPDGKIIVAGQKSGTFGLARYHADGSLDQSFGGDGLVITSIHSTQDSARAEAVAIQPDGKIVAAGWVKFGENRNFAVTRYHSSGRLDSSFSGDGKVQSDFDGDWDEARAVAIDRNGKIVAAGVAWVGGDSDFGVARFTSNGTLDTTFGGNGKVAIGFGDLERANALAIQPDGKIVLAGSYTDVTFFDRDTDFALARLNEDGSLDRSFDYDGKATAGLDGDDTADGLVVRPDGKIVAVGRKMVENGGDELAMVRYHPDGSRDSTLDGDGKWSSPMGGSISGRSGLVLLPDNGLVIGTTVDDRFTLVRLTAGGGFAGGFDGDGRLPTDFIVNDGQHAFALTLQPDGRLLVGGWRSLARYLPDGSLDTGGRQFLAFGPAEADDHAEALALQPDGKLVVAGYTEEETDQLALVRLTVGGWPDLSFGTNGRVIIRRSGDQQAQAVALLEDGSIVVAGSSTTSTNSNFFLARVSASGSLRCINSTDFDGGNDPAFALAVQTDQKIVVAGRSWNSARGNNDFGVARYHPDCSLDRSFSSDGKLQLDFGDHETANGVVVQPDGKIVLAGDGKDDLPLARLLPDGGLDPSFGQGGKVSLDTGGSEAALALARQFDGKLLVAGVRNVTGARNFLLARFMADGALDREFGTDGVVVDHLDATDVARALDVRLDGTIVVAGCSLYVGGRRPVLVQYNSRGLPDVAFNDGNPLYVEFASSSSCFEDVAFFGRNRIVVAGDAYANANTNVVLARFWTSYASLTLRKLYLPDVRR